MLKSRDMQIEKLEVRELCFCKIVKGKLQEDKQSKYGIRLLEILG